MFESDRSTGGVERLLGGRGPGKRADRPDACAASRVIRSNEPKTFFSAATMAFFPST